MSAVCSNRVAQADVVTRHGERKSAPLALELQVMSSQLTTYNTKRHF